MPIGDDIRIVVVEQLLFFIKVSFDCQKATTKDMHKIQNPF
jgi:hypothetical protein